MIKVISVSKGQP